MRQISTSQGGRGGFAGRTNKLVDGCYSFWLGGIHAILGLYHDDQTSSLSQHQHNDHHLFLDFNLMDRDGIIDYILSCCQSPRGGLRDKPEKYEREGV